MAEFLLEVLWELLKFSVEQAWRRIVKPVFRFALVRPVQRGLAARRFRRALVAARREATAAAAG